MLSDVTGSREKTPNFTFAAMRLHKVGCLVRLLWISDQPAAAARRNRRRRSRGRDGRPDRVAARSGLARATGECRCVMPTTTGIELLAYSDRAHSMKPRTLILHSAGTNCDAETAHAFELAGSSADRIHINRLLREPDLFSAIIRSWPSPAASVTETTSPPVEFWPTRSRTICTMRCTLLWTAGGPVIGICNGFQVSDQDRSAARPARQPHRANLHPDQQRQRPICGSLDSFASADQPVASGLRRLPGWPGETALNCPSPTGKGSSFPPMKRYDRLVGE